MNVFVLPDVGEGLTEAEIVAWHVAVGDHVVADQPLLSIETDKAVVEIPSPRAGDIAALHGTPGDVIAVGSVLAEFADGPRVDSGTVVGRIPAPASVGPASVAVAEVVPAPLVRATPLVRALAGRLGVDLATVAPTGPGGTVTRADVEAAAAGPRESATIEPLRGVRRAMDANMSRAHAQVVPATVTDEADIGAWAPGTDVTLRLVRAIAVACRAEPALNASYLGRDVGRQLNVHVDLGIAVDTEDGLFVPVLRNVAERDAADVRRGMDAMKADVRARQIAPEHLKGQTITLSNFGVFGGRHAALVVVPPQVAIVGAGRVRDAVVARDGGVFVHPVLPLSLTFDHRVVMGGEAARFLDALRTDLASAT